MGHWDGINRRKFPRVNYPCLVVVRQEDGERDVFLTHTENLGIGGMCVIIKKSLKMFTPVEVELDLLDFDDHIKCNGKIVWVIRRKEDASTKPYFYDLGIEFCNINEKDLQRIEEIIRRLAKQNV